MIKPVRLLLTAAAALIGALAIGLVATLLMNYHLERVPIAPPAEPPDEVSAIYFWLTLIALALVETALIRVLRRNWIAARDRQP